MTEIVLADDHAAFADALAAVLENHGLSAVAVECTLEGVVAAVARCRPDLCVVDRWFDDGDALTALPDLRAASPGTRIVVLSADPDRSVAQRALESGADGFVHKTRGVSALLDALARVAAGSVAVEVPPRWAHAAEPPADRSRRPATPLTGSGVRVPRAPGRGGEHRSDRRSTRGRDQHGPLTRAGVDDQARRPHAPRGRGLRGPPRAGRDTGGRDTGGRASGLSRPCALRNPIGADCGRCMKTAGPLPATIAVMRRTTSPSAIRVPRATLPAARPGPRDDPRARR